MTISFIIICCIVAVGAIAAMSLRNLVHCALCLTVSLAGLAALYLRLEAQFVGFAQILVYIGAVAILIVFAILLTRSNEPDESAVPRAGSWSGVAGVAVALVVFGTLVLSILSSSVGKTDLPASPGATVKDLWNQLMTNYVVPLEAIALLLTSAMIGAVLIAKPDKLRAGRVVKGGGEHASGT